MNSCVIEYLAEKDFPEWDKFLDAVSLVDLRQYSLYSRVLKVEKVSSFVVCARKGDEILGGLQVLVYPYRLGVKIGIVHQGPVVLNNDQEITKMLVCELKKMCWKCHLSYIAIELPFKENHYYALLKKLGFVDRKDQLPPDLFFTGTLLIDLEASQDQIFQRISKSRRRQIRRALEAPITFRKGTKVELKWFFDSMYKMAASKGSKPVVLYSEGLEQIWDNQSNSYEMLLWIGEVRGIPVCGALCIGLGGVFYDWLWAWNGEYSEYHISDLSEWTLIQYAKTKGYRFFDMVEVDPECVLAIRSGKEVPERISKRYFFGATKYKMSYGGEVHISPGVVVGFRSIMEKWIFHYFLMVLIENKGLKSYLKAIARWSRK